MTCLTSSICFRLRIIQRTTMSFFTKPTPAGHDDCKEDIPVVRDLLRQHMADMLDVCSTLVEPLEGKVDEERVKAFEDCFEQLLHYEHRLTQIEDDDYKPTEFELKEEIYLKNNLNPAEEKKQFERFKRTKVEFLEMDNYLKKLSDIRSKLKKKFKIKACGHFLEIDFVETAISNKIPFRCARVGCLNNHYIKRNDLELIEMIEDESEEVVSLQ
ncbi:hypothetical protein T08_4972 [Trichinella sp. T8]|nr:hypothetical protein T08_4972 [Trichinella sp. T8]